MEKIRVSEVAGCFRLGLSWACSTVFTDSVSAVFPVLVFYSYAALGNQLDYITAFTTLNLFALLQAQVTLFPQLVQVSLSL